VHPGLGSRWRRRRNHQEHLCRSLKGSISTCVHIPLRPSTSQFFVGNQRQFFFTAATTKAHLLPSYIPFPLQAPSTEPIWRVSGGSRLSCALPCRTSPELAGGSDWPDTEPHHEPGTGTPSRRSHTPCCVGGTRYCWCCEIGIHDSIERRSEPDIRS
jgi:hypothetical protein